MTSVGARLVSLVFAGALLASCGGAAAPVSSASPPAPASSSPAGVTKPASSAAPSSVKPSGSVGASASVAASGLIPIRAGYPQATITQGPSWVAIDEDFFKNNGLDASIQMIAGPQEIPAVLANEIQFGTAGATEVANADQKAAGVVMIATTVDYPFFWLYADKKYKTVQDLAGQTVGITAAGSSTDSAARLFLSHYGVLDKVKIAPAGGTQPSIFAAMSQGGIAAGILSPPVSDQAAKAGFVSLVDGVELGVPMNTSGVIVTRAYIQDHQDIVKRYLKAYQQGWTFLGDPANKTAAINVLAKYTKSDPATVEPGYEAALKVWKGSKTPAVHPEAVTNLVKLSDDPVVRATNPSDVIDNSLLQSIQ